MYETLLTGLFITHLVTSISLMITVWFDVRNLTIILAALCICIKVARDIVENKQDQQTVQLNTHAREQWHRFFIDNMSNNDYH